MKRELIRLEPIRTANILAIIYGGIMLAFALIALPILLIIGLVASAQSGRFLEEFLPALIVIILYPVMGVVFGWIGGFLVAAVYNFATRWTGGLLYQVRDVVETAPRATAAPPPTEIPGGQSGP